MQQSLLSVFMCNSHFTFPPFTLQAVEKVLAGAIRREMALEDICAKKTSEIMQLNRLVGFSKFCDSHP